APPHLRDARGDLPRIEQLRAAPVPREADPAVDPERPPRGRAAGLRRRPAGAELALRRGLLPRHPRRAGEREIRRGLQRRRPRRVREHRRGAGDPRPDRARRVPDRARHRSPRPRPPLLAELGQAALGDRLGGGGALRRGPGPHGRLVPRQRGLVGPDPLRRVPRVLREAVRASPPITIVSLGRVFRDDPPALELRGLTKRYDDGTLALENFDLKIPAGAFFGLLGPNGAGKTTLISAVCNLLRITSGEIAVFGEPHDSLEARSWIGLAEQDINLDRFLTVRETLEYHGGYFGMRDPEERAEELISIF